MRIVSLAEIEPVLADVPAIIEAVRQGFVARSQGHIDIPEPVQMLFSRPDSSLRADCHVKCAYSNDYPYFCVKVASGFYDNAEKGLPVNDGLVLLLSSETGEPMALFQDKGHLTSARTAAAGALAAELLAGNDRYTLGIVGTGHQAEIQARWISRHTNVSGISLWGRSAGKANGLADRLNDLSVGVAAVATIDELCKKSDIIVTTTPSTTPVLSAANIQSGQGIVALGADSPGKNELDAEIIARAEKIITDDHEQCLHHGEFGTAVRAGVVDDNHDLSFGECLVARETFSRIPRATSVVDLTGLGAQDLAIATLAWQRLSSP